MDEALNVLVIEDDYVQAQDLVRQALSLGQNVIGPYPDVHDALDRLENVDVAILDVRLGQENSFDMADCLVNRHVPFVFYTGYDRDIIPERFHFVRVFQKPCGASVMLHQLREQAMRVRDAALLDIDDFLPDLRRRARWLMPDHQSADRLVGSALRALVYEPDPVPVGEALKTRLFELLHAKHREERRQLLN